MAPAIYDWSAKRTVMPGMKISRGDVIEIYGTGLGPVTHPPATGHPASGNPLSVLEAKVTVLFFESTDFVYDLSITGNPPNLEKAEKEGTPKAAVLASWAGRTPGTIALDQINVGVPKGLAPGTYFIALSVNGTLSENVGAITIQ
jgi:hypothetical protein